MQNLVRHELLTAADELAREKGLSRERVLGAIEEALAQVAQSRYGEDANLGVSIDRKDGQIALFQKRDVVETVEDDLVQVTLEDARAENADIALGQTLQTSLPSLSFERIPSHIMRQVVSRLIKEVAHEKEYAEYKDRVGEIVTGTVKNIDYGQVILDLGRAEGVLMPRDIIPRERFRPDDRVRAYIREVVPDPKGFQIFLSRTHPGFMLELFKQEVPEVYSGVIQIKAIARDPGSRAKIGVASTDPSLDPVGGCVGVRGSRVQAVTQEVGRERIDVIRWSEDIYAFLVNAMTPATVTKIVEDDEEGTVQVVVPNDQLSLAVGRGGQNVQLASKLTGLHIRIISEQEESENRTARFDATSKLFIEALQLDDVTARFLAVEGFESIEDIALADVAELEELEGMTPERAQGLQASAAKALEAERAEMIQTFKGQGGDAALLDFHPSLTPALLLKLAKAGIKNQRDLAGLASDELQDIAKKDLSPDGADVIILQARGLPVPSQTPVKDQLETTPTTDATQETAQDAVDLASLASPDEAATEKTSASDVEGDRL